MGLFDKCKNCGKRNPKHVCYTGGSRHTVYLDAQSINYYKAEIERNIITGKPDFAGIPAEVKEELRGSLDGLVGYRKRKKK